MSNEQKRDTEADECIAWAQAHFRNADEFTEHDLQIAIAAWKASRRATSGAASGEVMAWQRRFPPGSQQWPSGSEWEGANPDLLDYFLSIGYEVRALGVIGPVPAEQSAPPVPRDDQVLMPREPSEGMIRAACLHQSVDKFPTYQDWRNSHSSGVSERIRDYVAGEYRAMVEAHEQSEASRCRAQGGMTNDNDSNSLTTQSASTAYTSRHSPAPVFFWKPDYDGLLAALDAHIPASTAPGQAETERDADNLTLPGVFTSAEALFEAMGVDDKSIAALERDAARYRWLRESGEIVASSTGQRIAIPMYTPNETHKAELDAAIDRAIAALSKDKP